MDSAVDPPLRPVSLRALWPTAIWCHGTDLVVTSATDHASTASSGGLFAVIRGSRDDGQRYLDQAIARGVSGLLVQQEIPGVNLPQCIVPDVRQAYATLCAALAGYPSRVVQTVGVTGTNGKTTTTWMLRAMLQAAGQRCGMLGTVIYDDGCQVEPAPLTTPNAAELQRWLSRMRDSQTGFAAIELSSHALHQDRAAGVELVAAVVTNITHDHLDYHGNYGHYVQAKQKIWSLLRADGLAIVNADDPGARLCQSTLPQRRACWTIGLDQPADISASDLCLHLGGSEFILRTPQGIRGCRLLTPGRHNISNALAATAAALRLGLSLDEIAAGLAQFQGAPGRMETIETGQDFSVIVDYAHTDDALSRVLQSLHPVTPGRLICVFGAGGDRDRTKRPKLGQAARSADIAIVTSDNPRSENPANIIAEILTGMRDGVTEIHTEIDRYRAIEMAIFMAKPGDCVLLAGKGHEQTQVVGHDQRPFDDRVVARQILSQRLRSVDLSAHHPLSPLRMRA